MEEQEEFGNRSGCNIQRSNEASSCSAENLRQKYSLIHECHRTLSGAEGGIKKTHARESFSPHTMWQRVSSAELASLLCVYLLKIGVGKACNLI